MAPLTIHHASGIAALDLATTLLQRARLEHPTAGNFEAADLQWWWRTKRRSDTIEQTFWLDGAGEPTAAVVFVDWSGEWAFDLIVLPRLAADLAAEVWDDACDRLADLEVTSIDTAVRDDDPIMIGEATRHGFIATSSSHTTAWLEAGDHPEVPPLPAGYRLGDRVGAGDRPHHFIRRSGPDAAERLAQTSLYRPDLDLFVLDQAGDVAAYGLFWLDPVTGVGLVEPMRTEDGHEGRGLARHVLGEGLRRLAAGGARRLKVSFVPKNERAARLYVGAGFVEDSTATAWQLPPPAA